MKMQHWGLLLVALIVGYVVGIKYPNLAASIPGLGS